MVKKAFSQTSSSGGWLLLHNIQASPLLLSCLPGLLEDHPTSESWRVWLTVCAGGEVRLPAAVQNRVCRVALDSPRVREGGEGGGEGGRGEGGREREKCIPALTCNL